MSGQKGDDANLLLFLGVVWMVCTYALSLTSMVMDGVNEAWIVGFSFFFVVFGGIKWAEAKGKQNSPAKADPADSEE